jgi:hypothetical protein
MIAGVWFATARSNSLLIITPDDSSRYVAVRRWRGAYTPVDIAASIMLPAKNHGVDIQLNYYCTLYV